MTSPLDQSLEYTLALPAGTRLGSRYELLRPLSVSTGAVTYVARDDRSDAPLIVKEFLPRALAGRGADGRVRPHSPLDEREFTRPLRRFALEAELLRDIDHENLVRVVDVVEENGTAYSVMTRHDGESLAETLAPGRVLSAARAVDVMLAILDALDAVHAEGVLHRAISPDAILLSPTGTPRLVGFSAGRHLTGAREQATPWMAIEQYGARGLGPWTDVYACAAVLYRSLVGAAPPTATDRAAGTPLIAPAASSSGVPPRLSALLLIAMSQSPEQRPHGAAEFRRRLDEATRATTWSQHTSTQAATPEGAVSTAERQLEFAAGALPMEDEDFGADERAPMLAVNSDGIGCVLPAAPAPMRTVTMVRRARARVVEWGLGRFAGARTPTDGGPHRRTMWILSGAMLTITVAAVLTLSRGTLRAQRVAPTPASRVAAASRPRVEVPANSAPVADSTRPVADSGAHLPPSTSVATPALLQAGSATTAPRTPVTLVHEVSTAGRSANAEVPSTGVAPPSSNRIRALVSPAAAATATGKLRSAPAAVTVPVPATPKVDIAQADVPAGDAAMRSAPPALLFALLDRFDGASKQIDGGDYAAGRRTYRTLLASADSLLQTYRESPALQSLRHRVEQADARALTACGAENEMLRRRGQAVKPCA